MSWPTNTGIISSTVPLFLVTSPLVTSSIECHQHWPYFHLSIIKKGKRTAVARPSVWNFRSSRMFEYTEESVAASQKHTPPLAACGKGLRNRVTDCKTAMPLYSRQKKKTQLSSRPHASVRYSAGLQACCLPFQKMHVNKGQANLLDCWPADLPQRSHHSVTLLTGDLHDHIRQNAGLHRAKHQDKGFVVHPIIAWRFLDA